MLQARFHLKHVMQSTDYNHLRREYTELNQQLVECKEEADWLAVFRLLLWKKQLQQVDHLILVCHNKLSSHFPNVKFWMTT